MGWFLLGFVLLNGVRFTDVADAQRLAAQPFALLADVERQFLHGSPFTFVLAAPAAELLGPWPAWILVTAGGFAVLALALRRFLAAFAPAQRHTILVVLASSPLLLVLTRWIGKSDPYLVGFYLLFITEPRAAVKSSLAAAMVLCHRELASVILVLHLVCARRDVAPLVAGLAAGHGLVLGYWQLLPAPPATRAAYAAGHGETILGAVAHAPLVHVAFALNWFWYFLAANARRARDVLPVVAVLGVAALATDYTRVASLCALPIILHVAVRTPAAALPRARAVPLLFLVQFQIEGFLGRVHDWSWLR